MVGLPLEGADIIGMFIALAIFGLYTCLFIQTSFNLIWSPSRSFALPVILTIMWLLTFTTLVIQTKAFYEALLTFKGKMDPALYILLWYKRWDSTAGSIMLHIAGVLGNIFITWRLYVMWKRDWRILIAPGALILSLIVCCSITVACQFRSITTPGYGQLKAAMLLPVFGLSVTINILVMSLMCFKIRLISKSVSNLSPAAGSFYQRALQVFIESGTLYAVMLVLSIIMQSTGQTAAGIIIAYQIPQVIALVPTLSIWRLQSSAPASQGGTGHDTAPPTSQQQSMSRPVFAHQALDTTVTTTTATTTQLSEKLHSVHFEPSSDVLTCRVEESIRLDRSYLPDKTSRSDVDLEAR